MTTAMYAVEGLICESCMAAVLENVQSLSGVSVVAMDLVTGGRSPLIVTSGTKLGAGAVRHAVEHIGFGVVPPKGPESRKPEKNPATRDLEAHPDREPISNTGGVRS